MKRLSDYKGEEAIELWADLITPAAFILAEADIPKLINEKKKPVEIASIVLKSHPKEAIEILTRIDETPVDGLNVIIRLVALINDIISDDTAKGFFVTQAQKKEEESSGSATVNTMAEEN